MQNIIKKMCKVIIEVAKTWQIHCKMFKRTPACAWIQPCAFQKVQIKANLRGKFNMGDERCIQNFTLKLKEIGLL